MVHLVHVLKNMHWQCALICKYGFRLNRLYYVPTIYLDVLAKQVNILGNICIFYYSSSRQISNTIRICHVK